MSALNKALSELTNAKKYKYFMWKNGLKNIRVDYSKYTREEFQEIHLKGVSFDFYEQWEKSEEYQQPLLLLMQENMRTDLYEIYQSVRGKALEGDDKAIKTFLTLEKEVNQKLKKLDKDNDVEKIDDGLILD
ncbi:hypothetical protein ACR77J_04645 [Tissierella praeacuta]|uniref:hypothetical protein n=1 Tax=Tissierella praeacuta TaxID=43131 RepID=UPI003DA3EF6A